MNWGSLLVITHSFGSLCGCECEWALTFCLFFFVLFFAAYFTDNSIKVYIYLVAYLFGLLSSFVCMCVCSNFCQAVFIFLFFTFEMIKPIHFFSLLKIVCVCVCVWWLFLWINVYFVCVSYFGIFSYFIIIFLFFLLLCCFRVRCGFFFIRFDLTFCSRILKDTTKCFSFGFALCVLLAVGKIEPTEIWTRNEKQRSK